MEILIPVLVIWLVCGFIGYAIGINKQAGAFGFWLGFLLGPLGVIAAALVDRRPPCPTCGTKLNGHPSICPACKSKFKWDGNACTYFPPS